MRFAGSTESENEHRFFLRDLQTKSRYKLRYHDRSSDDQIVEGGNLMKLGLVVRLPAANSSELIFLDELPALPLSSQPAPREPK